MVLVFMTTILLKKQVYCIGKCNSKELYYIFILGNYKKPTSQGHFEAFFKSSAVDWNDIYLLPRKFYLPKNINTKHCSFQQNILNNVLYLNKRLFKFGKVKSQLCSFCKSAEETITHLFSECLCAQCIWNQTRTFFSSYITIYQ